MDGVTDASFRYIAAKHGGPDVTLTEFVNIQSALYSADTLFRDFTYCELERPVVAQVYGKTPELFYNTGLLLQKTGQLDDAIKLYREAIAQRPNFAEALLNLGHALKAKGNQDEARACWKQALDFKPELAQGYFEQAVH